MLIGEEIRSSSRDGYCRSSACPNSAANRFSPLRLKLTMRLPGGGSGAPQFGAGNAVMSAAPSVPRDDAGARSSPDMPYRPGDADGSTLPVISAARRQGTAPPPRSAPSPVFSGAPDATARPSRVSALRTRPQDARSKSAQGAMP